jgi:hypothetical protein
MSVAGPGGENGARGYLDGPLRYAMIPLSSHHLAELSCTDNFASDPWQWQFGCGRGPVSKPRREENPAAPRVDSVFSSRKDRPSGQRAILWTERRSRFLAVVELSWGRKRTKQLNRATVGFAETNSRGIELMI